LRSWAVADRIAVLCDGNFVGDDQPERLPPKELVRWMVGRKITQTFPDRKPLVGDTLMEVRGYSVRDPARAGKFVVEDVSFTLRAGEIVGLAGLRGAGNSELLWSLFGAWDYPPKGEIRIAGEPYSPTTVQSALAVGLALVTNDRKATGLVLSMDVTDNATLPSLSRMLTAGVFLTRRNQRKYAEPQLAELNTRARPSQVVATLSGGNQQRLVLAKWLLTEPRIFLMDEPTRGVDVVAKHEVYMLLSRLAQKGAGIILIMSELPELLAMCDRIFVMRQGRICARFSREQATPEAITAAAM